MDTLQEYETFSMQQWLCLQMTLFLSPFYGIYINIAWHVFAVMQLWNVALNSDRMYLLYNSAFAECIVVFW